MTLNLVPKQKGLVTSYTHVKYDGLKSYQSQDMADVKVFFADNPMDAQTKGPTGRLKTICPRSIYAGAYKYTFYFLS